MFTFTFTFTNIQTQRPGSANAGIYLDAENLSCKRDRACKARQLSLV